MTMLLVGRAGLTSLILKVGALQEKFYSLRS